MSRSPAITFSSFRTPLLRQRAWTLRSWAWVLSWRRRSVPSVGLRVSWCVAPGSTRYRTVEVECQIGRSRWELTGAGPALTP